MELIGEEGFEPSTLRFGNACSSPLSYKPFLSLNKKDSFCNPINGDNPLTKQQV